MDVQLFLLGARFPGAGAGEALERTVAYAMAAERVGLDGVWLAEHHFISYGVCSSATVLAGHLLGATRRLRVGTAACVLSNREPVALGEETVLLDTVSGGRFRLGVARGGPWADLEVFGTGLDRYERGFGESLDVLCDWLSGKPRVSASGEFHAFREVAVVPRPSRPLPMWVAATSPSTVDLAAARGLPVILGMHMDDAEKSALLARYADTASAHGHDPASTEHAAAYLCHIDDTREAAAATLRSAMPPWMDQGVGEYVRIDGSPGPRRDHREYVGALVARHPVGPPSYCVDVLRESAARTGIRHAMLMVEGAGDPEATGATIARLGAEVLPHL